MKLQKGKSREVAKFKKSLMSLIKNVPFFVHVEFTPYGVNLKTKRNSEMLEIKYQYVLGESVFDQVGKILNEMRKNWFLVVSIEIEKSKPVVEEDIQDLVATGMSFEKAILQTKKEAKTFDFYVERVFPTTNVFCLVPASDPNTIHLYKMKKLPVIMYLERVLANIPQEKRIYSIEENCSFLYKTEKIANVQ